MAVDGDEAQALRQLVSDARDTLTEAERALYQTKNESRQDPLNFPIRLNDKLAGVMFGAAFGDNPPTVTSGTRTKITQVVAAADHVFSPYDLGEPNQTLGNQFRVLDKRR